LRLFRMTSIFPMPAKYTALSACALLLCGCIPGGRDTPDVTVPTQPPAAQEQNSTQPNVPARETANVSYRGIVRAAGISIYQEGTHRLVLDNGRFVLLESDTTDLNGYVGEHVEVFGAVRPTVEEGGMIMRVDRIALVREGDTPALGTGTGSSDGIDDIGGNEASAGTGGISSDMEAVVEDIPEVPVETGTGTEMGTEENVQPTESGQHSSTTSQPLEEEPDTEEAGDVPALPSEDSALVESMAADDYSPERWTQSYCTSHIGFCVPIHKNWWFKSFGNTSSHLWHVEIANAPVENLGNGIIVINLKDGSLESVGVANKTVRVEGGLVVGYRVWNDGTHFEISAPASLADPVRYMVQHITEQEE